MNPLAIRPVSRELLYIKIMEAIHSYITANDLKAGDRLPSERELAAVFQTSRNSIREAIRVLENQGMLEVRTGLGVFLKERDDAPDAISIRVIKSNFREIQEITHALETSCLRRAVERGTAAQKQQLLLLAQKLCEYAENGRFSEQTDHAFHIKLAEMSGNAAMTQMVGKLREEVFGQYWRCLDYDRSLSLETVANHRELARAILAGDEPRAQAEMRVISDHTLHIMDSVAEPGPAYAAARKTGARRKKQRRGVT